MVPFYKRRYFIEKQLQTKYIILTILLLLIYTVLFVVILIFPYIVPLTFDAPLEEQAKAARMLLALHGSIWPALGTVIVILSSTSIFITHKMAGPVYRLKKSLAEVSSGNLDIIIRLRKKDDLKDLAEGLNLVIDDLRGAVETLRGNDETLLSWINELEDQIKSNQISNVARRELIEKMKASRENTSQVMDKYSKPA
jgi:methyl-accepting chemotaxis protein